MNSTTTNHSLYVVDGQAFVNGPVAVGDTLTLGRHTQPVTRVIDGYDRPAIALAQGPDPKDEDGLVTMCAYVIEPA